MMIRVQIELPVVVVNKVNSFIHAILDSDTGEVSYVPASEWRLPLLTIRNFHEDAIWAIRDYIRRACRNSRDIGLSLTRLVVDNGGNVILPLMGAVTEVVECVTAMETLLKANTELNISANHNPSIVVGHIDGSAERAIDFRHPVSWNANSLCITRTAANGFDHRLFVIFFGEAQDVDMYS